MSENTLSRRRVLALSGTTIATLAGCTGAGGSSDESTNTTERQTTTTESGHHGDETATTESGHDEEGGHGHSEEGGVGEPTEHASVKMVTNDHGTHFSPHVVWVKPGGTVTWTNESGAHTVTAYAPANDKPQRIPSDAEAFDSGTLSEEGATYEVTFETPGVYDYYCVPHETTGMVGSVIVGKPDAHGQPGLKEPQDSLPATAQEKLHALNEKVNKALGHTH